MDTTVGECSAFLEPTDRPQTVLIYMPLLINRDHILTDQIIEMMGLFDVNKCYTEDIC